MSALATDPTHFLRWLWAHDLPEHPAAAIPPSGHAFVARGVYGRYLRDLLDSAEAAAPADVALSRIGHRVVGLAEEQGGLRLTLADGSARAADVAVLCIGNLPPRLPPAPGAEAGIGPRLIANPWDEASLARIQPADAVLVLGSGLTHGRRRGAARRPRPSRPDPGALAPRPAALRACADAPGTAPGVARRAADRARAAPPHAPRGRACRARRDRLAGACSTPGAISVPLLWQRLPMVERRRFLRHLRPYWDVHRHRMAPEIAAQIREMQASGRLEVRAGTIEAYQPCHEGVAVRFRNRGSDVETRVVGDWLVNCAGPALDFRQVREPLIQDLLARGWCGRSRSGSASRPRAGCSCCGATGRPNRSLFALGPLTRGTFWETTGVPEIREQGRTLAQAPGDGRRRARRLGPPRDRQSAAVAAVGDLLPLGRVAGGRRPATRLRARRRASCGRAPRRSADGCARTPGGSRSSPRPGNPRSGDRPSAQARQRGERAVDDPHHLAERDLGRPA